jgi:hypothetical protein
MPLPGWTFEVEEISAGVYRVRGVDRAGRSVEQTGTDPDAVLEECRRWAARYVARPVLSASFYFSYSQFLVYDRSVELPGCAWTDDHTRQGFARREQNVSFGTLDEFGTADLIVNLGPYAPARAYQRVIEVPLHVPSGRVLICGPEDSDAEARAVDVEPGHYRLVAAQALVADERETIDLFFEKVTPPSARSRILRADEELHPPDPLLETVDVA